MAVAFPWPRKARCATAPLEQESSPGQQTIGENVRRCFTLNLYRCTMIVVNICHILAIFIVIRNIIASRNGGRPIVVKDETA
ncbi:hypothetical protein Y032_0268g794 [Ancylostoma ceylanicum]|uniref:Uncharacterized protein n=1 Tax=Ancylostoma ceylanicum TaxID=53326 RepID=A0A016S9U6_9BILA|nr:hypothetical protein Y032_0268g794 [Ancylostoma ceylanicum]